MQEDLWRLCDNDLSIAASEESDTAAVIDKVAESENDHFAHFPAPVCPSDFENVLAFLDYIV